MTDTTDFQLHPKLNEDCHRVADWPLCRVLLAKDATYPWLILVPRRDGLRDFHNLEGPDLAQAASEMVWASQALEQIFQPHKMNVAALGNQVPQLHVHVIARFETDPAWPGPIWGVVPPRDYSADALQERLSTLQKAFGTVATGAPVAP
ncbi:MAG: HIT family protein [Pseudomonadota bacterium]